MDIIVGKTLLGSEVLCIQRIVLRHRKRATGTLRAELGQHKAEQVLSPMRADPHLLLSRSDFIPLPFFFNFKTESSVWNSVTSLIMVF